MKPFLSITIPTYNRMQCLKKALDVVLAQVGDDPDIEVVISDNASLDNTPTLCAEYVQKHPRVRYFRNEVNLGFDRNVLACIQHAGGDYVSFFSDDDLPSPGFFKAVLARLRASQPAILYVNHTPFFSNDPARLGKPMAPVQEWMTREGKEFFKRCGLGFISALTVRVDLARRYAGAVAIGRAAAHLDIVARVALTEPGLYIYDGRLTVFSRYNDSSASQILRQGTMGAAFLHRALYREGRLSARELKCLNRRMICGSLARHILADRCQREHAVVRAGEVTELFGSDPFYYLLAYPLVVLPTAWIRAVVVPMRAGLRFWRHLRHG